MIISKQTAFLSECKWTPHFEYITRAFLWHTLHLPCVIGCLIWLIPSSLMSLGKSEICPLPPFCLQTFDDFSRHNVISYYNIDHGIYNQWSNGFSACFTFSCVNIQLISISIRFTETPELVMKSYRLSANEHLTTVNCAIHSMEPLIRQLKAYHKIFHTLWRRHSECSKVVLSLPSFCFHLMCCYPQNEFLILRTVSISYSTL